MGLANLRERFHLGISLWKRLRGADPGLMAAAVAYNAFFALVPLSLAFVAGVSFVGQSETALERTKRTLEVFVPADVVELVEEILRDVGDILEGQQAWVIALSVLVALWSGSRAVVTLQKALARIETMEEDRRGIRVRLIGIALTLGAGASLIIVSLSLVAGNQIAEFVGELTNVGVVERIWALFRFPIAGAALFGFLYAVYRWGPPRPFPAAATAALAATVLVGLVSVGFGWYLANFPANATLGVLGAVGVALLWLYLSVYVMLVSAAAVGFGLDEIVRDRSRGAPGQGGRRDLPGETGEGAGP